MIMDGPWSKHCIWFMLIRPIIGIPINRYMMRNIDEHGLMTILQYGYIIEFLILIVDDMFHYIYIYTSHHPHEYPLHFWVNQCNLTMEHPTSSNSWFYIPLNSHEDPIESPQVPPPVLNCWNKPMKTIDISPTKTIVITELCSPT